MPRNRSMVTVQITGIPELEAALEDLPEQIKDGLREVVRESAEAVQQDTQARVRVDTGRMRDGVTIDYEADGLSAQVGWSDRDLARQATHHEHGTQNLTARPALLPALEAERARIRDRIATAVQRAAR